jgi:hypothetical protein
MSPRPTERLLSLADLQGVSSVSGVWRRPRFPALCGRLPYEKAPRRGPWAFSSRWIIMRPVLLVLRGGPLRTWHRSTPRLTATLHQARSRTRTVYLLGAMHLQRFAAMRRWCVAGSSEALIGPGVSAVCTCRASSAFPAEPVPTARISGGGRRAPELAMAALASDNAGLRIGGCLGLVEGGCGCWARRRIGARWLLMRPGRSA